MSRPIGIAYHLIWTVYGWWLPNDPRGSGSKTIASDVLVELGELHHGRKETQPPGHVIRDFYREAHRRLKHEPFTFAMEDRQIVAEAFAEAVSSERYTCYACAVMPDHVHLLLRKHRHQAEQMIVTLQDASRLRLRASVRRDPSHPVWTGGGGWKVFLDHPEDVRRTIRYIERNPERLACRLSGGPS